VIYECTHRTINPQNDTNNCTYESDLKNFICNSEGNYTGEVECLFDYNSNQLWNQQYKCFSGTKKCGASSLEMHDADTDSIQIL
jgi:hypothetical protein